MAALSPMKTPGSAGVNSNQLPQNITQINQTDKQQIKTPAKDQQVATQAQQAQYQASLLQQLSMMTPQQLQQAMQQHLAQQMQHLQQQMTQQNLGQDIQQRLKVQLQHQIQLQYQHLQAQQLASQQALQAQQLHQQVQNSLIHAKPQVQQQMPQPNSQPIKEQKEFQTEKKEKDLNQAITQSVKKDNGDISYTQLLKQQCQYQPKTQELSQHKPIPPSKEATNMPMESLKQILQQATSEILRKVLARSDSLNQLRQIIDIKAKKVKPKNYENQIFQTILDKEAQRVQQENLLLSKIQLKIEDKNLIKQFKKNVSKMLKPFKGLQFDDFLNNEIHLNEIMVTPDQQNDPIKENRKRHRRILDAALKEQVVDTQIVISICVQISRQAFFNKMFEYINFAYDYLLANQSQFQFTDIQGIQNLKKRLQTMKGSQKVTIQTGKKLDKMFWQLLEQNQEVQIQIQNYKEKYAKAQNDENVLYSNAKKENNVAAEYFDKPLEQNRVGLRRLYSSNFRNGEQPTSPHVTTGVSATRQSLVNTENRNMRSSAGGINQLVGSRGLEMSFNRRQVSKGQSQHNTDSLKLQTRQGTANNETSKTVLSSAQQADSFASTVSKQHKSNTKQLAPIPNLQEAKKAQSLITKKLKAKDLENTNLLGSQTAQQNAINTPDLFGKKQNSTFKQGQTTPSGTFKESQAKFKAQNTDGKERNSTENLFNLIQQTKTKNTMILEPISQQHRKLDDDGIASQMLSPSADDQIGIGLHNTRMRKTEYGKGFRNDDSSQSVNDGSESPSKVLRTWSRPLINLPIKQNATDIQSQPQMCTCQRYRKRINQNSINLFSHNKGKDTSLLTPIKDTNVDEQLSSLKQLKQKDDHLILY